MLAHTPRPSEPKSAAIHIDRGCTGVRGGGATLTRQKDWPRFTAFFPLAGNRTGHWTYSDPGTLQACPCRFAAAAAGDAFCWRRAVLLAVPHTLSPPACPTSFARNVLYVLVE